jgi:hypothetical protein
MISSSSFLASTNSSIALQPLFEELGSQAVQRRQDRPCQQLIVVSGGRKKGGSCPGKCRNVDCWRGEHEEILMQDYFNANPLYNDKFFCHQF